jgi:hypothetical protein
VISLKELYKVSENKAQHRIDVGVFGVFGAFVSGRDTMEHRVISIPGKSRFPARETEENKCPKYPTSPKLAPGHQRIDILDR